MYGSDFYLDDSGDIVFTTDNDLEVEESTRIIAQDLREEAGTPYGSLPWEREAGSHFFEMINDSGYDSSDIILELERLAYRDARIDASSVSAEEVSEGVFRLIYTPLGSVTAAILKFDLADLLGESYE